MIVDLHIHTNCSDGTWNVAELINNLRTHQIQLFAITDHDSIENSRALLVMLPPEPHFRCVPGVEISCTHQGKEHHITAYAFDPQHPALLKLLARNQQRRRAHNDREIELLAQIYPEITYARYQEYTYDRKRGGWKSLNFLLDAGIVTDLRSYFECVKPLDNPITFSDPVEVLTTIQQAGGFAFLAHPNAYCQGNKMSAKELQQWLEFGIAGLECYSSYASLQDAEEYVKFCARNNLLISGGSDCHGAFLPKQLGTPKITLDMLNLGFL